MKHSELVWSGMKVSGRREIEHEEMGLIGCAQPFVVLEIENR